MIRILRREDSYFRAQHHHLARRRSGKRATVAVAHSIVVAAYVLRDGTSYRDLGPRHFDTLQRDRLMRYDLRRLRDLGYPLELEPKEAAA